MTEYIINNENDLLDLAYSLGQPVASRVNGPIIDKLIPLNRADAHKQSLSANYGTDNFPFHTDGAYFRIPPRLIILRYISGIEKPTPTVICDLNNIDEESKSILKFSVWKIKSRGTDFLSSILSEDGKIFRYDKCVMRPAVYKNENSEYFENLISNLPKTEINWTFNKTVVLNNWTSLHARPKVRNEEVNYRTIQRIMVS